MYSITVLFLFLAYEFFKMWNYDQGRINVGAVDAAALSRFLNRPR